VAINNPVAAEDAMQQCKARGFDYAETFERQLLSAKALGIKCNYVNYEQRVINVNVQDAIPVVVS